MKSSVPGFDRVCTKGFGLRTLTMDPYWAQARNILAIRLDNLGDVLVTTPAIHAIKDTLPEAQVTLLASPVGAQVAELNPDIDEVIVYEAPWMDPWMRLPQDPAREQRMIETLRGKKFDGAIIFTSFRQSSLPSAYLCYLAGIPLRLGASVDGSGSLLTTRHKYPEGLYHEVERGLNLVGAVGFATQALDLVLKVPDWLKAEVRARLLAEGLDLRRPVVVLHPGCSMPARTYPWERFGDVADGLVRELGCQVILTGTKSEVPLVERIRTKMSYPAHSWAGQRTFKEFAALIAVSDLIVTNNTGPQHMAAAVKTPVIVLFAWTNPPEQWGPWRVPHCLLNKPVACALCYQRVCPYDHACLDVTPEEVIEAAANLLAVRGPGSVVRGNNPHPLSGVEARNLVS